MTLACVQSRALLGLAAPAVTVEVHLANGLPSLSLVGLADVEVKEARERVRCALQNSGLEFPNNKRITVNLAPADLPKDSGRFDLPIALGILAASGQIPLEALHGWEFAGELSLSGALRPVRGGLVSSLHGGDQRLVLPLDSAREAALAPAAQVFGAAHLLDVVAHLLGQPGGEGWQRITAQAPVQRTSGPDLADVKGQVQAKRTVSSLCRTVSSLCRTVSHCVAKSGMIGVFRLESQMLPGNGKFERTGLGSDRDCKESTNTAFNFLKANGNRISGSISTTMRDYIINYQDLQGIGMTGKLALPTLIALCSIALGRPTVSTLAVLGEISISGTILKVDELANSLQVCLDSGAKKVLLPITSAADLGTVPPELVGSFNLIFYSSAEDAVFKALGVE